MPRPSSTDRATPAAPPTSRSRVGEAARDRIVDAAIALFGLRGYRGTTIAAIADRVGMSDAGVLHHYPTKQALFWAVVELFNRAQMERFSTMLEPGGLAAIENLAGWGAVMEARPELLRLQVVLSAEAIDEQSEIHDYFVLRYHLLRTVLVDLVHQGVAAGDVRADVDAVAEMDGVIAYLDGARLLWIYSDGEFSIERGFRSFVALLVDRIRAR